MSIGILGFFNLHKDKIQRMLEQKNYFYLIENVNRKWVKQLKFLYKITTCKNLCFYLP